MKEITIDISNFEEKGKNFLSTKAKFSLDKSFKKFDEITNEILSFGELQNSDAEEVLEKYWELYDNNSKEYQSYYTSKKKRKELLFVFSNKFRGRQISTSNGLHKFIQLFKADLSELTLHKLLSAFHSSWEDIIKHEENFDFIRNEITRRIHNTDLKLSRSLSLKKYQNLVIEKNSPSLFAQKTINERWNILKLCKEIGIRYDNNSFISYVQEEIFEFYLNKKDFENASKLIDKITQNYHEFSTRSKKKIVSSFIIAVQKYGTESHKETAKSAGYNKNLIGDPNYKSNWIVWENGNEADQKQLENARKILNKWILSSFIDVFFDKLISDPKRRIYWRGKIDLISSVQVYGSRRIKDSLLYDDRLKPYIDESRFKTLSGSGTNAGIMMEIGNYQIVEFTDQGALYCYKTTNNRIPLNPKSISNLKDTGMHMACTKELSHLNRPVYWKGEPYSLQAEGRITHAGNKGRIYNDMLLDKDSWMNRMDAWIDNYVL